MDVAVDSEADSTEVVAGSEVAAVVLAVAAASIVEVADVSATVATAHPTEHPQVLAAAGEDGVQLAARGEEGHEHGGVDAAVDVERGGLPGVEEDRAQSLRELSARARRARHARRT